MGSNHVASRYLQKCDQLVRRMAPATEKFVADAQNGWARKVAIVATENASTHVSQPGLLGVMILLELPFLSR